ncbi:MAG: hypothetical protein QOG59_856 [Solirubrobacteraceae bacterium]|jgi:myo-inositol catabolism protein IolC|nr:hypothetical protein [Solirubrobacteraceae bacterium]
MPLGYDGKLCIRALHHRDSFERTMFGIDGDPTPQHGFAIGRSIWWDALKSYLDQALHREAAVDQIAENYLQFVRVYERQEVR